MRTLARDDYINEAYVHDPSVYILHANHSWKEHTSTAILPMFIQCKGGQALARIRICVTNTKTSQDTND